MYSLGLFYLSLYLENQKDVKKEKEEGKEKEKEKEDAQEGRGESILSNAGNWMKKAADLGHTSAW